MAINRKGGTGTDKNNWVVNPSTNKQTLNTAAKYVDANIEINAMPVGSATTPATTKAQSTPSITVDANGKITASVAATSVSVTPTVSTGWVSSGTAGTVTMSASSNTKQMTVQAAKTWTPTTTSQSISSGTYLTGVQTIAGDDNLIASNIKAGVTIFGITGTFDGDTSSATATASDIKSGKTAYINGGKVTGTAAMATATYSSTNGGILTLTDGFPVVTDASGTPFSYYEGEVS